VVTTIEKTAWVNETVCKACSQCEKVCQFDAISAPLKEIAKIKSDHCTACGLCVSVCPFDAIELISR